MAVCLAQLPIWAMVPQWIRTSVSRAYFPHPFIDEGSWKPGLTHLPLDKMATISQTTFKNAFNEWKCSISIRIELKGTIDNKSAFVKVMAWRRIGAKALPEPMLTQFTDAYMRHQGVMS